MLDGAGGHNNHVCFTLMSRNPVLDVREIGETGGKPRHEHTLLDEGLGCDDDRKTTSVPEQKVHFIEKWALREQTM